MPAIPETAPSPAGRTATARGSARAALVAAVLGFFVITLDTTIVNLALPAIHDGLGGGITGLQWIMDGYTLMFAALLLSGGAVSDRTGAHRAFAAGMALFVAASLACGLAPTLSVLVAARIAQGAGAAIMLPSSLALIREAFPNPVRRGRAIAVWTISGSVAAAAGPIAGGLLAHADWRLIFTINVPAGAAALIMLARAPRSPRSAVPLDWAGQVTAAVAMGSLTFAAIEAGAHGYRAPADLTAFALAAVTLVAFALSQKRGKHPMLPPSLIRSRTLKVASANGFAFLAALNGTVFLYSLYLQQHRGLTPLAAGLVFVPMTVLSAFLGVPTARLTERYGPRVPIVGGLLLLGASLITLAALPAAVPIWLMALVMIPVGICGPLAMQPTTGILLESVPAHQAGVASAVFNTTRQIGGTLAIAVFGALFASQTGALHGLRVSLLIAAVLAFIAATGNLLPDRRPVDAQGN